MTKNFFNSFTHDEDEAPIKKNNEVDSDDSEIEVIDDTVTSTADNMEYADNTEDDENTDNNTDNVEEEEKSLVEESTDVIEDIEDDSEWVAEFVNPLAEEGILYYDPEKEYSAGEEGLVEVLEDTINKRLEESIPEDYRSVLTAIKAGVPVEDWVSAQQTFDYSTIDLEDEDNQINIISEAMELQGIDEEDIKEKIETLQDAGTTALKKEAQISQKFMIKQSEKQKKE